jgi:predicted porin
MKKTVLAFAVAAAVGVPAMAAADTALYGRFNISLDFVDDSNETSHQLASNSSRLGVRGSEDLGIMGLSGVYQIEAALQNGAATQAFSGSNLTARNTYVGLASDQLGELRLGKHDTPYKMSTLRLNFFADTLGDMNHVSSRWAPMGGGADSTFYRRLDNTMVYMSPNLEGLQFMASYTTDRRDDTPSNPALDPSNTSDKDQPALSMAATFEQGPMYVTVAYEQQDNVLYPMGAGANPEIEDANAWKVGGTYQIQDLTLAALYENLDTGTNFWGDRDSFHIGAKYQLGQAYLMGSFSNAGDLEPDDTGAQMFALGGGYSLSPRTGVYTVYAHTSNDDAGGYGLVGSGKSKGVTPTNSTSPAGDLAWGEDVSGFQVGVTHNF